MSYVAVALVLLAIAVPLGLRGLEWHRRWGGSVGGTPVRYEGVTPDPRLELELELGIATTRAVLAEHFKARPELLSFCVIVRSNLTTSTVQVERCLPITRAVYVAIVPPETPGHYIAHEVLRHMVPQRLTGDSDAGHARQDLSDLEFAAKRRLDRALRSAS